MIIEGAVFGRLILNSRRSVLGIEKKKHWQGHNHFVEMQTPHIQHMYYQTESKHQMKKTLLQASDSLCGRCICAIE